jgi:triosephosphate isomerase
MQKYIVGNWKSNKSLATAASWVDEFNSAIVSTVPEEVIVAIAPTFSQLQTVQDKLKEYPRLGTVQLAVQDISPFAAGSYTGAIAPENFEALTVSYAIVGHSERRRYFHETHQDVANKVARCLEAGITPIVCVDDEYIADQAASIDQQQLKKCIVAYEELGAIGTGENESPAHVASVIKRIKHVFGEIPVLYGGSVNSSNVEQYSSITDGVLVGGASLDAKAFAQIVSSW